PRRHLRVHSFPTRRSSDLDVQHPQARFQCRLKGTVIITQSTLIENGTRVLLGPINHLVLGDWRCLTNLTHEVRCFKSILSHPQPDRKSTRLNSSHVKISYA